MSLAKRVLAVACTALAFGVVAYATVAKAADKKVVAIGSDAVADLEQRIAELEATTARKGNRKVSLQISGSINKAFLTWDDNLTGNGADSRIVNGVSDTYITFAMTAKFSKEMSAGAALEIGTANWNTLEDQIGINQSTEVTTRRASVWVESPIGRATLGKDSQATDGIVDGTSVANTAPAVKMLSFHPLLGSDGITENLDLFDGQRLDVLRYDSPLMQGFRVSASWSRDGTGLGLGNVDDVYDVALRYTGSFDAMKFNAGVGYRKGAVFPGLDPIIPFPQVAFDQTTISGSASAMHVPSGLFLNVAAGQAKFDGGGKITSWEVMPGIETHWSALGRTTFFGEYANFKMDGASDDLTYMGGGIVQAIDAAAMSLYVSGRQVDAGGSDEPFAYVMLGARMDF